MSWMLRLLRKTRNQEKGVAYWYIGMRPYISERGARKRGPVPNPRTNIETTKDPSSLLVEWNSSISFGTPGANIADAIGVIRHCKLTSAMLMDFFLSAQLRGFEGSLGPSHQTTFGSWFSSCGSLLPASAPASTPASRSTESFSGIVSDCAKCVDDILVYA